MPHTILFSKSLTTYIFTLEIFTTSPLIYNTPWLRTGNCTVTIYLHCHMCIYIVALHVMQNIVFSQKCYAVQLYVYTLGLYAALSLGIRAVCVTAWVHVDVAWLLSCFALLYPLMLSELYMCICLSLWLKITNHINIASLSSVNYIWASIYIYRTEVPSLATQCNVLYMKFKKISISRKNIICLIIDNGCVYIYDEI